MQESVALPVPVAAMRRPQRMATNVPTDLLRSFVAIVDSGSMAQATATILLTQSALSLQMKRLEDLLQQRVFRRHGRSLALTPAGEELVALARQVLDLNDRIIASLGSVAEPEPIQLGLVQDFADTILPTVLTGFHALHPRARIQLRVAGSTELVERFDRAACDLVVGLGRIGDLRRGSSRVLREVRMAWVGDPTLAGHEELPLVLLEQPCAFRTAALESLERQARRYRITLETPSLPGLRAGLRAGLGITCRTLDYARFERLEMPPPDALPPLPGIDVVMVRRDMPGDTAADLAELLEEALTAPAEARA